MIKGAWAASAGKMCACDVCVSECVCVCVHGRLLAGVVPQAARDVACIISGESAPTDGQRESQLWAAREPRISGKQAVDV